MYISTSVSRRAHGFGMPKLSKKTVCTLHNPASFLASKSSYSPLFILILRMEGGMTFGLGLHSA